jgi:hypothetical protein
LGMGVLNLNVQSTLKTDGCITGRAVEAQEGLDWKTWEPQQRGA